MPDKFVLGIDIGSGACKITLLQIGAASEDAFVKTYSKEYATLYPKHGWAEQDSSIWIDSVSLLIKRALEENKISNGSIEAVCLSGVTHSPVLLNKDLNVIGNVMHITDNRSSLQTNELRAFNDIFLKTCFNPVSPLWTISMLKWIKDNEPQRFEKIYKIVFPKDFLRLRLTETIATDFVDAQGTLFFNTLKKQWDSDLAKIIDLKMSALPDVLSPFDIAGKVTKKGAAWSFLKEGTPVITGTTDTLLEILAAGNLKKGDCSVKLATFGRVCILSEEPAPYEGVINYSYIFPGLWYPGTGTKSCASSYRWVRDQFFKDYLEDEKKDKNDFNDNKDRADNKKIKTAFEKMDFEASKINAGSSAVIFHPYLLGEGSPYNDSKLRGDFLGLTLHHSRAHLARAVLEGTSFSLKDSIEFLDMRGIKPEGNLKFIGGGSKSSLWVSILSDILGMNGIIPFNTDASYGAAVLCSSAIKAHSSLEEAVKKNLKIRENIYFSEAENKKYTRIYNLYKKSKDILTELNHSLSELS